MSFINNKNGKSYSPGFFLAHEECVRETRQIAQNSYAVVTEGETKHVPMGTPYPTNDGNAIGILYEDVDVTTGDMPGSVVTKGDVIESRLGVELNGAAKSALQGLGFKFVTEAEVVRPY